MGKISAIFLQDYSPQYISQCFVWSRLQRCKWCRFYCFPKGRLSSLITFTVRKFYWCSNSFFLPDFTLLLPVVNSRRQFWVVLLLPGCSGPSCTQVFLLIFHWSPSRWWTFGSWRACKFELITVLWAHVCPLHKCTTCRHAHETLTSRQPAYWRSMLQMCLSSGERRSHCWTSCLGGGKKKKRWSHRISTVPLVWERTCGALWSDFHCRAG